MLHHAGRRDAERAHRRRGIRARRRLRRAVRHAVQPCRPHVERNGSLDGDQRVPPCGVLEGRPCDHGRHLCGERGGRRAARTRLRQDRGRRLHADRRRRRHQVEQGYESHEGIRVHRRHVRHRGRRRRHPCANLPAYRGWRHLHRCGGRRAALQPRGPAGGRRARYRSGRRCLPCRDEARYRRRHGEREGVLRGLRS